MEQESDDPYREARVLRLSQSPPGLFYFGDTMNTNHVYASNVANKTVDGVYELHYEPTALPSQDGPIYFRTDVPISYEIEGLPGKYLLGFITTRPSNLNITTLNLVGPDGLVYSHDTIDTNEAIRTFSKLKAANAVTYEDIGTVYVDQ